MKISKVDNERIRLSILKILSGRSPVRMTGIDLNKGYGEGIIDLLQKDLKLGYCQMVILHDKIYAVWSKMMSEGELIEVISPKGHTSTYAIKK